MEGTGRGIGRGIWVPLPGRFMSSSGSGKAGNFLASTAIATDFVDVVAGEIAIGVERAVEWWMSEIEGALTYIHLTSLGRLNAVREILDEYKRLTGKAQ